MLDNPISYIYMVVVVLIAARSVYTFATFTSTIWWLKHQRSIDSENTNKHFTVIIPVLREQSVLRETIEWFLGDDYPGDKLNILIVTTAQEVATPTFGQTTIELAIALQEEYSPRVRHIHYPVTAGLKADQVNFALGMILEETTLRDSEFFVALYDADSRPHPQTFKCVSALSATNRNL